MTFAQIFIIGMALFFTVTILMGSKIIDKLENRKGGF